MRDPYAQQRAGNAR